MTAHISHHAECCSHLLSFLLRKANITLCIFCNVCSERGGLVVVLWFTVLTVRQAAAGSQTVSVLTSLAADPLVLGALQWPRGPERLGPAPSLTKAPDTPAAPFQKALYPPCSVMYSTHALY